MQITPFYSVCGYSIYLNTLPFPVFSVTANIIIALYRSLGNDDNGVELQLDALHKRIELAQKKKGKLLGYNASGQISDRDFLSMNAACDREISQAGQGLYGLEQLSRVEWQAHL